MKQDSHAILAKKILSESLKVKEGESVTIETWSNGLDFATKVVLEAKRVGAIPLLILEDEKTFIEASRMVPKEKLSKMGEHEYALLSETDAYVFIPGPPIAGYTTLLSDETKTAATAYSSSWYEAAAKANLRGVRLSFGYVGREMARLLGKRKEDVVNHLVEASLCDFTGIRRKAGEILERFEDGEEAKVVSGGEKLEFSFKGGISLEDGVVDEEDIREERNVAYMPPGWVAKEVDQKSVEGTLKFDVPITKYGRILGVSVKFKDGELVEWDAKLGKEKLDALFSKAPQGERAVLSAGIGMNPLLKHGYSQDRFVSGTAGISLGVVSPGKGTRSSILYGVIPQGSLTSRGKEITFKGKLA